MEKRLIRDHEDIKKAIDFYGEEWEDEIREEINMFPTILIACYCDDIEFGEYYQFTGINNTDFISMEKPFDYCLN